MKKLILFLITVLNLNCPGPGLYMNMDGAHMIDCMPNTPPDFQKWFNCHWIESFTASDGVIRTPYEADICTGDDGFSAEQKLRIWRSDCVGPCSIVEVICNPYGI